MLRPISIVKLHPVSLSLNTVQNVNVQCLKSGSFFLERERQQFKGLGNPFFFLCKYPFVITSFLKYIFCYHVVLLSALFDGEPLGNYFSEVK